MNAANALPDPRRFPALDDLAPDLAAMLPHAPAAALAAPTRQRRRSHTMRRCAAAEGSARRRRLQRSRRWSPARPSVDVARHLLAQLDLAWRDAGGRGAGSRRISSPAGRSWSPASRPRAARARSPACSTMPRRWRRSWPRTARSPATGTFALANVLTAAEAIDVAALPALRAWRTPARRAGRRDGCPARALRAGAARRSPRGARPCTCASSPGTALARGPAPNCSRTRRSATGACRSRRRCRGSSAATGSRCSRCRARRRGCSPRCRRAGPRSARFRRRLFASNAIRKLRASVGEPSAVISAHRAAGAPGGGELRLSLSSPFEPRDAEGFRCPLYPLDRVADVVAMLRGLLARLPGRRRPPARRRPRRPRRRVPGCRCCSSRNTLPEGGEALH